MACASLDQMANLPSMENIICTLHDCRDRKSLTHAMKVYIDVCDGGLDAHSQIAHYLIPTLVQCNSLHTAENVFNKLLHRNEYCWTSLLHGYVESGQSEHALYLLERMEDDCVQPTKHTLSILLKASAKLRRMDKGQELHAMVVEEGFDSDAFVGISLMNMYAKCGLLGYARDVFDELSTRSVVSWTTLIAGYSEYGDDAEALSCLEQMQNEGLLPDSVAFACGLKACGAMRSMEKGRLLHTDVMNEGVEGDSFVCSSLVDMYAECGSLVEAQEAFNDSPVHDIFMWNVLFSAYAKHGMADKGLDWLRQMRLEGISPDANSYVCSLKACKYVKAMEKGQEIYSEVVKEGRDTDYAVSNSLVDMYLGCGSVEEAEKVFDKLQGCDVVLWNTLIAGYLENMQLEKVLTCLEQMLLGGVPPDAATFICVLKACGISRGTGSAHVFMVHTFIAKLGMGTDSSICSSLVTVYGECGLFAEARQVFDRSQERQASLWNALLAGFNMHELGDEVLRCLEQMRLEGALPTASILVYGLKACGILKAVDLGREIHDQIVREGFESELFVGNSLIDMYGKLGALAEAEHVFEDLHARDVVTWTTLIAAYTDRGCGDEALDCFEKMQECKEVSPNSVTYIFTVKASSNVGAIGKGQEIHSWVIKKGFEKGSFLCSSLMDMYVECGLLAEAFSVFSERPVEDLPSWNTLIRGYTDYGYPEDALNCLERMQHKGIVMDPITFVCGLKACICLEDIEKGREIYAAIVKSGFERVLFVGNMLLDLYAKYGSDAELYKIFDALPERDVVSWTALIAGYNEHGVSETILACLKQMHLEGVFPNVITFMSSLKACDGLEFFEWGQRIHAEVVSDGCEGDSFVSSCLVDMYCRYGLFAEALDIFDEQPIHDVVSWNTLISGYAEQEICDDVLACLQMMLLEGVNPDAITCICGLKACGSIGATEDGRKLHTQIVLQGVEKVENVENALMDMYVKCGLFLEAQEMFDVLSVQDVASWTMLMGGYVENGLGEKALYCMEQMKQHGVALNAVTFVCSLRACGSVEAVEKGQEFHAEIVRRGFEKDPFVFNALVDMYAKCGLLADFEEVFDKLLLRDVFSWSTLVVSYAELGFNEEVLECFESMQLDGISPDADMFLSFLKACGSMRALERGRSMHADACKFGLSDNPLVENAVVHMYAKCDALVEALEVFDNLSFRDVGSWNALLMAYTEHGHNEEALECLKQMQVDGLIPNLFSYLNILKACGNIGALNMGQEILSQIIKEGLGSNTLRWSGMKAVKHGKEQDESSADVVEIMLVNACVDMFGKCGSMIDAMQVFEAMASRDLVTWNALIWGYARQGNPDHVFFVLDRMEEEGVPSDKVTCLGVLNLCSHLGLLYQGQEYLDTLANHCGSSLSLEHLNCFLDLLARAGQLEEAVEVLRRLSFSPDLATWTTLIGACRIRNNEKLGRQALMMAHEYDAGAFVFISNMYAEIGVI